MNSRDAPNLEFADSAPIRPGRKHRRGRGQASRKTILTTGGGGGGSSQITSTPMLSESHNYLHKHPYTKQANYYASDSWDNAALGSPRNNHTTNNNKDDNSCTGSLTYSASSSVQSAESSNDSSFADIIKLLDSTEGGDGGVTDVHKFIANNSMKAICNDNQKKKNKIKKLFSSMSGGYNEELNYSSNDSEDEHDKQSETDVDNKILDTIAGHDDDNVATRTLVTSHSMHDQEEVVEILPITALSSPSTPRSRMNRGDVTPFPNIRTNRCKSTPPDGATSSSPSNVSRTGSRNSRSSSEESIDTPTPSSPTNPAKPPVCRKGIAGGKEGEGDSVEELSMAFYAKSWMCGFTDAFNF